MKDFGDKLENAKDKVAGEVKEVYGKVTGDKSKEVEGKIQSEAADAKKAADDRIDEIKDSADRTKDKVVGETKEAYGKVTGDKSKEVEGKIQSGSADLRSKADKVVDDVKDAFRKDK